MDRNYDELVAGRIFVGGAADTDEAVQAEQIDTVFDVRVTGREEATGYTYIHSPITEEQTAETIQLGAKAIAKAYKSGESIYIHCGSGKGRASVMAAATLLELGEAEDVADAVDRVKAVHPDANIRPNMQAALEQLYK